MNLIKKMKLKSMLRNCDYQLAGTVIQQQYYNRIHDQQLNRLIEDYMKNPGFEEAVKLIEYDEMLINYFTESCTGGLYVRKNHLQQTAAEQEKKLPAASPVIVQEPRDYATHNTAAQVRRKLAADDRHPAAEELPLAEKQPVMEVTKAESAEVKENSAAVGKMPNDTDSGLQAGNLKIKAKEARVEEEFRKLQEEVRQVQSRAAAIKEEPKEEPVELKSAVTKKIEFPNVISTLNFDIKEMKKQILECQRAIAENREDREKMYAWIDALEDAVDEFTMAVKVLQQHQKK